MKTDLTRYARTTVKELKKNISTKSKFAVRVKNPPRDYKRGYFFDITVGDKTGDIKIKYWGGQNKESVMKIYNSFEIGDVIEVSGDVSEYQNKLQISVNEGYTIRKCTSNEYDGSDFLPHTKKDIDEMFSEVSRIKDEIKNEYLKALLDAFFDDPDYIRKFKEMPSSMVHHHNFLGGQLEHINGVVKICKSICNIYDTLDRELLLCCAILHDSGKILEYKYKTSIEYTVEGTLIAHTVLCEKVVREKMDKIVGFPEELKRKISHMILSHHGKNEWGSPVEPRIPEALALHYADNLDAKLVGFLQIIDEYKDTDEVVIKDWRYGYVYLK